MQALGAPAVVVCAAAPCGVGSAASYGRLVVGKRLATSLATRRGVVAGLWPGWAVHLNLWKH
jgi:hypothetical protein